MKVLYKIESVLILITAILCAILLINLIYKLRSMLPWRVNCWFCNRNFWVKFVDRNSWTCLKCEQYNGFTKDGDYNKTLISANDQTMKTPKIFQKSSPKNGLCKMCNINQQLKVTQLANFIPMNEKNFDDEIETYRVQLEKAYKLCSPCRKTVQMKLHKEKESLLGSKLLENRTPEKKYKLITKQNLLLKNFINNTSMLIAGILLILVSIELYNHVVKSKNLYRMIVNIKEIAYGLLDRVVTIIKIKTAITFPAIESYDVTNFVLFDSLPKHFNIRAFDYSNDLTQKALGGFVCLIQIIGHFWNINSLKYTILIDLLWSVFVITSVVKPFWHISSFTVSCVKFISAVAVLFIYRKMKSKSGRTVAHKGVSTPKRMKNLSNGLINSVVDDDDSSMDTDDDVSLSNFGLHNFTDSSNETVNPVNNSPLNGRSFTPRIADGIWTKPKQNLTYCVNSVINKSPSNVSDNVFIKPSFSKYQKLAKDDSFSNYQKLAKDDSDSELDESISTLCISSPKKNKQKKNPIFSLRKFNATPNFVAPTPLTRTRPLISPSKLGHSTSWVAGGYWEGERNLFSINGSRSSSQSSGFESQTSSMTQRNLFSQPPSREQSVCGDPTPMIIDGLQNCNPSNYVNCPTPQNFIRMSSPVFPQMQYNSHVHIPQPRLAPQNTAAHNVFFRQHYVPNTTFKSPNDSGLIKLPQCSSFASSH